MQTQADSPKPFDGHNRFVIAQRPNTPLIIAIIAMIGEKLIHGAPSQWLHAVVVITLVIWAYLEISSGANWFRRLLGIVVMANEFIQLSRP